MNEHTVDFLQQFRAGVDVESIFQAMALEEEHNRHEQQIAEMDELRRLEEVTSQRIRALIERLGTMQMTEEARGQLRAYEEQIRITQSHQESLLKSIQDIKAQLDNTTTAKADLEKLFAELVNLRKLEEKHVPSTLTFLRESGKLACQIIGKKTK